MPENCTCPECRPDLLESEEKPLSRFVINVTIKKEDSEPWEVYRGPLHCNEITEETLEEAINNGKNPIELIKKLIDLGALSLVPGKEFYKHRKNLIG